jgi:hypothetical protein
MCCSISGHLPTGKFHTRRQNWKKVVLFSTEIGYIRKILGQKAIKENPERIKEKRSTKKWKQWG